jgi:hypothetical protein
MMATDFIQFWKNKPRFHIVENTCASMQWLLSPAVPRTLTGQIAIASFATMVVCDQHPRASFRCRNRGPHRPLKIWRAGRICSGSPLIRGQTLHPAFVWQPEYGIQNSPAFIGFGAAINFHSGGFFIHSVFDASRT